MIPIREQGLQASGGSTPFDVLFLMLSMFVIAAALILVALLFQLGIEQRSSEIGLLRASGFSSSSVTKIWLMESTGVSLVGAVAGSLIGIGYAATVLWGLRTFWVGAVSTPFLTLHVAWWNLPAGIFLGMLVCIGTTFWAIRKTARQPAHNLLSSQHQPLQLKSQRRRLWPWLAGTSLVLAVVT